MAAENKISFEYVWPLKLDEISDASVNDFVYSPVFCVSSSYTSFTFRLQLFPKGYHNNRLFVNGIYDEGPSDKISADIRLNFLCLNNTPSTIVYETLDVDFKKQIPHFALLHDSILVHQPQFRLSLGITVDDKLTSFTIKLKCLIKVPKPYFKYKPQVPMLTAEKRIGSLLDAVLDANLPNRFSDIVLKSADGAVFRCHKVILAKCAPFFFEKLLESEMVESSATVIELPILSGDGLTEVLRFIYQNQVINENLRNLAEEILNASEMYQLDDLKRRCELCLFENVNVQNAIFMTKLGDLFLLNDLKRKAVCMTAENFQELVKSEWLDFMKDKPDLASEVVLHACQRMNVIAFQV